MSLTPCQKLAETLSTKGMPVEVNIVVKSKPMSTGKKVAIGSCAAVGLLLVAGLATLLASHGHLGHFDILDKITSVERYIIGLTGVGFLSAAIIVTLVAIRHQQEKRKKMQTEIETAFQGELILKNLQRNLALVKETNSIEALQAYADKLCSCSYRNTGSKKIIDIQVTE